MKDVFTLDVFIYKNIRYLCNIGGRPVMVSQRQKFEKGFTESPFLFNDRVDILTDYKVTRQHIKMPFIKKKNFLQQLIAVYPTTESGY